MDIKRKVFRKIFKCAKKMGENEVGGLILGQMQKNGNCFITDIVLLKQKVTSTAFELDEDDMMEFTKTASAKVLKSVVGWWHSHGTGMTFWSDDDDRTFKRLCNFLPKFCVGIVVSTQGKGNYRLRVDVKDTEGKIMRIDNIIPDIIESALDFGYGDDKELGDIDEIVTEDSSAEVGWEPCETCDGTGVKVPCEDCKGSGNKFSDEDEYDEMGFLQKIGLR